MKKSNLRNNAIQIILLLILTFVLINSTLQTSNAQLIIAQHTISFSGIIQETVQTTQMEVGADVYWGTTVNQWNSYSNLYTNCGLTYMRLNFNPGIISSLHNLVPEVTDDGVKIIGLLYAPTYEPNDPTGFGDWVYDIVSSFKDDVHVWEIWNEPNLSQYFSTKDPQDYAYFLKEGYINAKAADPTCTVLGVSGVFTHSTAQNFLRGVYDEIGTGYMDALSWHPYCYPYPPYPSDEGGHPNNPYSDLPKIKQLMESYGDNNHIWITEIGWPTNLVSETEQADNIVYALEQAKDWGWVDCFIIYSWKDSGSMTNKLGITTTGTTAKPSYYAVQEWIEQNR